MGHTMLGQYVPVQRTEHAGIADFQGITKVLRELPEEPIELADKFFGGHPVALKLEQAGTGMWLELRVTIRREHQVIKQFCIKEAWIRLSCPGSILCLFRIAGNRDFFPHLETHFKVFGNLVQVTPELIRGRRAVKRRIIPSGPEEWLIVVLILAVLAEAFLRKFALRVLALIHVALPPFVGPGGSAKSNEG